MINDDARRELFLQAKLIFRGHFGNECLFVSTKCLALFQKSHPDAFVAIGICEKNGREGKVEPIIHFLKNPTNTAPIYHAWIELGNGDIADLTLAQTHDRREEMQEYQNSYIDAAAARKIGITYHCVIMDPIEVARFEELIRNATN